MRLPIQASGVERQNLVGRRRPGLQTALRGQASFRRATGTAVAVASVLLVKTRGQPLLSRSIQMRGSQSLPRLEFARSMQQPPHWTSAVSGHARTLRMQLSSSFHEKLYNRGSAHTTLLALGAPPRH